MSRVSITALRGLRLFTYALGQHRLYAGTHSRDEAEITIRKSFLVAPAVLAATLLPTASNAGVHKCHGQVATIDGTPGDDILHGTDFDSGDVIAGLGGNDAIYGYGPGSSTGKGRG
jgi:hypothetical protein